MGKLKKICRICDSNSFLLVWPLSKTPIGDNYQKRKGRQRNYPLNLYLCKKCKLVQQLEVVSWKKVYGNDLYVTQTSHGLANHFKKTSKKIISLVNNSSPFIVDIGSNDGTQLKFYQSKKYKVLGIDPAKKIARKASREGIETLPKAFTLKLSKTIFKKYGYANVILVTNLFANVENLNNFLAGIKNLLEPTNGILVIETFSLYGLVKNNLIDSIYHEHISFFTVKTLEYSLKKHSMEIFYVSVNKSKGGSLQCFIQLKEGNKRISKTIQKVKSQEKRAKLSSYKTYQTLIQKNKKNKKYLLRILEKLRKDGKSISGYGASVGTTTLVYEYGLANYIDVIYDDEKRRHNLRCPGNNIRVKNPRYVNSDKLDYLLILAWRYAKLIMKKNYKFYNNGGKFILPLPKAKIL